MSRKIKASMTGTVWKICVKTGDSFSAGDTVAILESMKMEIPVEAERDGTVVEIVAGEGQPIEEDAVIFIYQ